MTGMAFISRIMKIAGAVAALRAGLESLAIPALSALRSAAQSSAAHSGAYQLCAA